MSRFSSIKEKNEKLPGFRTFLFISLVVFFLGTSATFILWQNDYRQNKREENTIFATEVINTNNLIQVKINTLAELMRASAAIVSLNPGLNEATWAQYTKETNFRSRYPWVFVLAYAQLIPTDQLEQAVAEADQEMPGFHIFPDSNRDERLVFRYVEPLIQGDTSKIIGFDIFSEENRRKAAEKARDSGSPTLTPPVTLIQDQVSNPSYGLYVPIYRYSTVSQRQTLEQKRENFSGLLSAAFRANDFFSQGIVNYDNLEFKVYDGTDTNNKQAIYESPNFSKTKDRLSQTSQVQTGGSTWTIEYVKANNPNAASSKTSAILATGIMTSLAVAISIFLFLVSRARAILYREQISTQAAKDDLLSLASHQLRTPATAVKQYIGMILEGYLGKPSQQQREALTKAYASNERQLEIINQILYVAKADAGQITIAKSKFDLNTLCEEVLNDIKEASVKRNQIVRFKPKNKTLILEADPNSLHMVIENLLTNASKYTPEGGEITLMTNQVGNTVIITVIDTGVGIKPEDMSGLFQKFSRIDNELSIEAGGSGIGLYIDKILIDLHGGHIEVESQPGKGSSFSIYLPAKGK